jgi:enoyl-CoA hydratase/carnithine racemase
MTDVVLSEQIGHVRHLTLNRPDKLNAIDYTMLDGLDRAFQDMHRDESVRAVVISGNGKAFCAGADLELVQATMSDPSEFGKFLQRWHEVFTTIERSPLPTFGAIHGVALAGGFELLQVCDFVALADSARIGDQHAALGLFPGGGGTQRLQRQIGYRRAAWLTVSGEWIDAPTALDWGLANWSFPKEDLLSSVIDLADAQGRRSAAATAAIKLALYEGRDLSLSTALELERRIGVSHMITRDAATGVAAFAA